MKKRTIFIILIIIFLILGILLKFIPFKVTEYKIDSLSLKIPAMSFYNKKIKHKNNFISDKGNIYTIQFKNFRSKYTIEKELKKILDKYEIKECNNNKIYYNKNDDFTIINYKINKGFLFNTFYIEVLKGNTNINICSKITDPSKLKYVIMSSSLNYNNLPYTPSKLKYLNKDGNISNIYYNHSDDILFYTGTGKAKYLQDLLQFGWISMQDILDFLEYQEKNNKAKKINEKDYTLYYNKDFSLLKCTNKNNNDIYISNKKTLYNDDICK